ERGLPAGKVRDLVNENTTGRALGFIGERSVDVLELNLDLDALAPAAAARS
ncbi:potassium-transporting ATPase subunit C, partial [Frankia sp. Mgl5]